MKSGPLHAAGHRRCAGRCAALSNTDGLRLTEMYSARLLARGADGERASDKASRRARARTVLGGHATPASARTTAYERVRAGRMSRPLTDGTGDDAPGGGPRRRVAVRDRPRTHRGRRLAVNHLPGAGPGRRGCHSAAARRLPGGPPRTYMGELGAVVYNTRILNTACRRRNGRVERGSGHASRRRGGLSTG